MREPQGTVKKTFSGLQSTPLCEIEPFRLTTVAADSDSQPVTELDHELERKIQRVLRDLPGVTFDSLVIRRLPAGVCLQGYATIEADEIDLGLIARRIEGVGDVLDRIVSIRRNSLPPR